MPASIFVVTQITGQAWVRGSDGSLLPLREGMSIPADASVVTADGGSVQMQPDGLPAVTVGANRDVQLGAEVAQPVADPFVSAAGVPADDAAARVLAALQAGDDPFAVLDPTAAVVSGSGGDDGGSSFTRIAAIVETTNPLGLEYPRPSFPALEEIRLGGYSGQGDSTGTGEPQQPGEETPGEETPGEETPGEETPGGEDPGGEDPENPETPEDPDPEIPVTPAEPGVAVQPATIPEDAEAPATGSFVISAPAGLLFLTVAGRALTEAQVLGLTDEPVSIVTSKGRIELIGFDEDSGTVSFEYFVNGPHDHTDGDDSVIDSLTVEVTDSLGRQVDAQLQVQITDTEPLANADVDAVSEDGVLFVEGNVITGETSTGADDLGADGWAIVGIAAIEAGQATQDLEHVVDSGENVTVGVEIQGNYGTITIDAEGNYAYTLNNEVAQHLSEGQVEQDVFTYTLKDADGDLSTTTITIQVTGSNDAPVITPEEGAPEGVAGSVVVSEEGLEGGIKDSGTTDDRVATGTVVFQDIDDDTLSIRLQQPADGELQVGDADVIWALSEDGQTLTGTAGGEPVVLVTIDNDGVYEVRLKGALNHPDPESEDALSFDIGVVVSDGIAEVGASIRVTVEDDAPQAVTVETDKILVEGDTATIGGNLLDKGAAFGADGAAAEDAFTLGQVTIDGEPVDINEYGTLALDASGNWSFSLNNDADVVKTLPRDGVTVAFEYTLTDKDGDTSPGTISFELKGHQPDAVFAQISVDKTQVFEGTELFYTVKLVDANGDEVQLKAGESVTVSLAWSGSAATDTDVDGFGTDTFPTSVTISGAGVSETGFSVVTLDDSAVESRESLSLGIAQVDGSVGSVAVQAGSASSVTTTIHDDDLDIKASEPAIENSGLNISTWQFTSQNPDANDQKVNELLNQLRHDYMEDGQLVNPGGHGNGAASANLEAVLKKLITTTEANGTFFQEGAFRTHGYGGEANGTIVVEDLVARTDASIIPGYDSDAQKNVAEDTAVHAHGVIYLEKGKTYTVKAQGDDSLRVVLGDYQNAADGHPQEVNLRWGTDSTTAKNFTFVAQESGLYTFDMYMHNQAGAGMYSVSIVEGEVSNGNVGDENPDIEVPFFPSFDAARAALQAQSDSFTIGGLVGTEGHGHYRVYGHNEGEVVEAATDTGVRLSEITLNDAGGTPIEMAKVEIQGLPEGAVLTDGTPGHTVTIDASGRVDVTDWDLHALELRATEPGSHTLTVLAYEEGSEDFPRTQEIEVRIDAKGMLAETQQSEDGAAAQALVDSDDDLADDGSESGLSGLLAVGDDLAVTTWAMSDSGENPAPQDAGSSLPLSEVLLDSAPESDEISTYLGSADEAGADAARLAAGDMQVHAAHEELIKEVVKSLDAGDTPTV